MSSTAARPPGGDHRHGDGVGHRAEHLDVEALQGAVAIDVGDDQGRDARVLEPPGDVDGVQLAGLRSSPGTATLPPRTSTLTAICPGCAGAQVFTSSGSRTAAVPRMTRLTPASIQRLDVGLGRARRRRAAPADRRRCQDRADRRAVDRSARRPSR